MFSDRFSKRMTMKTGVERGERKIVMPVAKRIVSLTDLLNMDEKSMTSFLAKSVCAGMGVFGSVTFLKDENGANVGAIKKIQIDSDYIGDGTRSPFRSEPNEFRIMQFLWKIFGETRVTSSRRANR